MELPLVFVIKLVWNVVGGNEKFETLKIIWIMKQSGGKDMAGAQRENTRKGGNEK